MTLRPDALFHPLYLSPRRGLDVDPFEALPKKRSETLDAPRRPMHERTFHAEHVRLGGAALSDAAVEQILTPQ